jgi:hypothetical protein
MMIAHFDGLIGSGDFESMLALKFQVGPLGPPCVRIRR